MRRTAALADGLRPVARSLRREWHSALLAVGVGSLVPVFALSVLALPPAAVDGLASPVLGGTEVAARVRGLGETKAGTVLGAVTPGGPRAQAHDAPALRGAGRLDAVEAPRSRRLAPARGGAAARAENQGPGTVDAGSEQRDHVTHGVADASSIARAPVEQPLDAPGEVAGDRAHVAKGAHTPAASSDARRRAQPAGADEAHPADGRPDAREAASSAAGRGRSTEDGRLPAGFAPAGGSGAVNRGGGHGYGDGEDGGASGHVGRAPGNGPQSGASGPPGHDNVNGAEDGNDGAPPGHQADGGQNGGPPAGHDRAVGESGGSPSDGRPPPGRAGLIIDGASGSEGSRCNHAARREDGTCADGERADGAPPGPPPESAGSDLQRGLEHPS